MKADNPYVGLVPFTEAEGQYFFGRQKVARQLALNLLGSVLLVVYGRSGVGKTSVLRAGVRAALDKIEPNTTVYFNRWAQANVAAAIVAEVTGVVQIRPAEGEALNEFAARASREMKRPLVLILDQFEEYFQYREMNGSEDFERALARMANGTDHDIHVVIALRADALSRLDSLKMRIPQILTVTFEIGPLDAAAAEEAIKGPVAKFNELNGTSYTVDDALVSELIRQKPDKGSMPGPGSSGSRINTPFLQLALFKLWKGMLAKGGNQLSLELLTELRGVAGIAQDHLEEQLAKSGAEDWQLMKVFDRLVTGDGMKIAVSAASLVKEINDADEAQGADLEPKVRDVLDRLEDGRILSKQSADFYEIQHDVLVQPIGNWLAAIRERQRDQQRRQRAKQQLEVQRTKSIRRLAGVVVSMALVLAFVSLASYRAQQNTHISKELGRLALEASESRYPEKAAIYLIKTIQAFPDADSASSFQHALATVSSKVGRSVVLPEGHVDQVWAVAFSPDGRMLATGSADKRAIIWDVGDKFSVHRPYSIPKMRCTISAGDVVRSVSFNPPDTTRTQHDAGGEMLMTGTVNGRVRFWDTSNCKELPEQELKSTQAKGKAHIGWARTAVFSHDGRWIATGSTTDGVIRIWDGRTHQLRLTLKRAGEGINRVSFHPANSNILASATNQLRARLWDIGDERTVRSIILEGHSEKLWDASFSPDGKELATASDDDTVNVWPVQPGKFEALRGSRQVEAIRRFVPMPEQPSLVIETTASRLRGPLPAHHFDIWRVAFAPAIPQAGAASYMNGRFITGSWDNTLRVWDAQRFEMFDELLGHTGPIRDFDVDPTGAVMASASEDGDVRLWPLRVAGLLWQQKLTQGSVVMARLDPGNPQRYTAITRRARQVEIVSGADSGKQHSKALSDCEPVRLRYAGEKLPGKSIIQCVKGALIIWDSATGEMERLPPGNPYLTAAIGLEVDVGRGLAWAAYNVTNPSGCPTEIKTATLVRMIDLVARKPVGEEKILCRGYDLAGADASLEWFAFAKTERDERGKPISNVFLARLADVVSAERVEAGRLEYKRKGAISLAFSKQSAGQLRLAAGSIDAAIQLWDVPTDGRYQPQSLTTRILLGHVGSAEDLQFNPDASLLASASSDDSIRIWNAESGVPLKTFKGHDNSVNSVDFSSDGKQLLSGSVDGSAIAWGAPATALSELQDVCTSLSVKELTPPAIQEYVSIYTSNAKEVRASLWQDFSFTAKIAEAIGFGATRPSWEEIAKPVDCELLKARYTAANQ